MEYTECTECWIIVTDKLQDRLDIAVQGYIQQEVCPSDLTRRELVRRNGKAKVWDSEAASPSVSSRLD